MRAKACTKCRQAKVRCDGIVESASQACSRCRSLRYACVFDASFKRTSKAKLISRMASEIHDLRQSLEKTGASLADPTAIPATTTSTSSSPLSPLYNLPLAAAQIHTQSSHSATNPTVTQSRSPSPNLAYISNAIPDRLSDHSTGAFEAFQSAQASPDPNSTVSPVASTAASTAASAAASASIGNVSLSAGQVAEMFKRFFARYAPHVPFQMRAQIPSAVLQRSPLLFWVICAITSHSGQAQLLEPLVKTLITNAIHEQSHSVETVQALLLLCIWPFRVSFLGEERSYFYSSMATQISLQLGLHRSSQPHMYRLVWETPEPVVGTDVKLTTYLACFVVDRMVSGALGNPPSIVADSHILNALDDPSVSRPLSQLCRIYHLLSQSILEISSNGSHPSGLQDPATRLNLITHSLTQMSILGSQYLNPMDDMVQLHFVFAKVQILTFALQNDIPVSASDLALNTLEEEVCDLVDLCESMNLSLAPGHVRRAMSYCGFVLSRLLRLSHSARREVLEEKLRHVSSTLAVSACSPDDVVNKACIMFQTLPFFEDLEQSPPLVSRMASWISYDERRIFWENWSRMRPPDGDVDAADESEIGIIGVAPGTLLQAEDIHRLIERSRASPPIFAYSVFHGVGMTRLPRLRAPFLDSQDTNFDS